MSRVIAVLLFLSGDTGLMYEVVWSKVLASVLGNSGQAHAIVLATFMGGLALGAWLFGRLADRLERPLALYGGIELFVGLSGLLFPLVQGGVERAFLSFAGAFSEETRLVPKLCIAAIALLPPTVAMGGTMPAMLKHATAVDPSIRSTLARLYAVNSLGAAAGAWFAGTVWIPSVGLSATSAAAGGINLTLAAVSIALSRGQRSRVAPATDRAAPTATISGAGVAAALFGVACTGFVSMTWETGWIRLMTLVMGASTFAFTWIVTAFIIGIAAGSQWLSRREERDSLRTFGALQLALAASVCVMLPLYVRAPYYFLKSRAWFERTDATWGLWQGSMFAFSLAVMFVPTFILGASFPAGARVVAATHATLGQRVGLVWAVNTVGTVVGALLAGLVLMPRFGIESLFIIGIVVTLGAGLAASFTAGAWPRRGLAVGGALAAFAVYLVAFTGWGPTLAQTSPVRVDPATTDLSSYRQFVADCELHAIPEFVRDDTFATVLVAHSQRDPTHRFLMVNGKPDASTGKGDRATQSLIGHLGLLFTPHDAKRVAIIGAGAAMTLSSVLTHPVERVDLVEISPAVIEAARRFGDVNGHSLDDPRTHLHIDDARTFLATSNEKWDALMSEPSNPWVSGISSLFTTEFFDIVANHLTDEGVLLQWMHTYELGPELLKLVVHTLRSRFPYVSVWQGAAGDALLVASRQPLRADFETLLRRISVPAVAADLAKIDVAGIDGVLSKQMMSNAEAERWSAGAPLNTDDVNLLEYAAPKSFYTGQSVTLPDQRRKPSTWAELELSRWLAYAPLNAERAQQITRSLTWGERDDAPLTRAAAQTWYALEPTNHEAGRALAKVAMWQGEPGVARAALGSPETPADALLWVQIAAIERKQRQSPWVSLPLDDLPRIAALARLDPEGEEALKELCGMVRCDEKLAK